MTVNLGEEFKIVATPGQELLRKLAYLARIDNDSIITGGLKRVDGFGGVGSKNRDDKELDANAILALALANDSSYQQTLERVSSKLDSADHAAEEALLEIDRLLAENARRREELIGQAYKREDGTALFLGEDDKSVRDEHGRKLSAEEAANLPMDELRRGPRWEQMEGNKRERYALETEKDDTEQHNQQRQALRERIKQGDLSQDELESIEQDIDRSMPDRMRRHLNEGAADESALNTSSVLTNEELASLNAPRGSAASQLFGTSDFAAAPAAKSAFTAAKDPFVPGEEPQTPSNQAPLPTPGQSR